MVYLLFLLYNNKKIRYNEIVFGKYILKRRFLL